MRDWLSLEEANGNTSVLLPLLIGLSALTLSACDSGGSMSEEPEDLQDDEVVLSEETVVIDSSEASLQKVEGDTLTFDVTGSDRDFETGSIIAGEQGRGFLRRVKSVEVDGNKRVLITERASLADAVDRGRIDTTFSLSGPKGKTRNMKAVETAKNVSCRTVSDGIDLEDVSVGSEIGTGTSLKFTNGSASFDPDIDFDVVIDDGIERFRLVTSGDLNFATDVQAEVSRSVESSGGLSLASCELPTFVIPLGKLPVTVTPEISFNATASVSFENAGTLSTGLESSNSVTLGAEYAAGSWSPISDRSRTFEGRGFETDAGGGYALQGSVKPEILFKIYYTAGPLINAGPYLRTEADVEPETIDWTLLGGLNAGFGGSVEFLDFALAEYEHTFSFAVAEITSGTIDRGGDEAVVSGVVTDEETDESIKGATVTGTAVGSGDELFNTTTDSSGEYEASFSADPEPNEINVTGQAEGYESVEERVSFSQEMEVSLSLPSSTSDNQSPNEPNSPSPADGETTSGTRPTLTWDASDPDGDDLTYDIYFGTSSSPSLAASDLASASYDPGSLENETTYYWQVVAEDPSGATAKGPVWSLTTPSSSDGNIYAENFDNDPNYTASYSTNVEGESKVTWEEGNGTYYAKVNDQSSDWWAVGISPSFEEVDPSVDDFVLSFEFNPIEPDWGHYPGIYFVDSKSYEGGQNLRDEAKVLGKFAISWADNTYKKFVFGSGDNRVNSPTIPNENEWYSVKITYSSENNSSSMEIKREDGSTFFKEEGLPAAPVGSFDQLFIGERGSGPAYGDQAKIRVDDIELMISN